MERCFPYTVCLSVSIIQGMPLLNVPAAWKHRISHALYGRESKSKRPEMQ